MESLLLHLFDCVKDIDLFVQIHLLTDDVTDAKETRLTGAIYAVNEHRWQSPSCSSGSRMTTNITWNVVQRGLPFFADGIDQFEKSSVRPRDLIVHIPGLELVLRDRSRLTLSSAFSTISSRLRFQTRCHRHRRGVIPRQLKRTNNDVFLVLFVQQSHAESTVDLLNDTWNTWPVFDARVLAEGMAVQGDNAAHVLIADKIPEIGDGVRQRTLGDNEGVASRVGVE